MSLPVPKLDDRGFDDLVEEAKRLIKNSCPQWTDFNASDPGMTLVDVMAWMTEIILYRLNRVPDRNYIKFLELMGVHLKPAEPARAWVKFNVPDKPPKLPKTPLVRPGTRLSTARKGDEEPVPFETATALYLTTAQVAHVFSRVAERITDHTPHLEGILGAVPRAGIADEPAGHPDDPRRYPIFYGQTEMPHVLYLLDSRLRFGDAQLTAALRLRVLVELAAPLTGSADIEWERWDGTTWVPTQPTEDSTRGLQKSGAIIFDDLPKEDVTPLLTQLLEPLFPSPQPQNKQHYILRARLVGVQHPWRGEETYSDRGMLRHAAADDSPAFKSVKRALEINPNRRWFPEKVIHEAPPPADQPTLPASFREIDPSRDFLPFGSAPRAGDILYIRCAVFERPKATVVITISKSAQFRPAEGFKLKLAWEYSSTTGWKSLALLRPSSEGEQEDGSTALTFGGQVRFIVPEDSAWNVKSPPPEPGPYIRVRVMAGIYGPEGGTGPVVESLSIHFADEPLDWDHYIAENYLSRVERTKEFVDVKLQPARPFEIHKDKDPALYVGFTAPLPNRLQRLYVALENRSHTITPVRWEYWKNDGWETLQVVDHTKSLTQSGPIEFIGPPHWKEAERFGVWDTWLRCRVELSNPPQNVVLKGIHVNTVEAVQGRSFRDEILGSSTGEPRQRFRLIWTPVLPGSEILVREKPTYTDDELERLRAELGAGAIVGDKATEGKILETERIWWIRWRAVESFYESKKGDRHYTLDPLDGVITFGDGTRGRIPPRGTDNIKANVYQQTNGARGNVGSNTITVLEDNVDGVDKVFNVEPAEGGADPESIEDAKLRGPYELKTRYRAVTADDFRYLAAQASGQVAKTVCLPPNEEENDGDPRAVEDLKIVIVPKGTTDKPRPDGQLIRQVSDFLDAHRLLTVRLRVAGPRYCDIRLSAEIKPLPQYAGDFTNLMATIERRLRAFVHPLPGAGHGPDDDGWPMGRTLHKSELYYVIEKVPGVDYVEKLTIWTWDQRRQRQESEPNDPDQQDTDARWSEAEAPDNVYIARDAFHYFREIEIVQR